MNFLRNLFAKLGTAGIVATVVVVGAVAYGAKKVVIDKQMPTSLVGKEATISLPGGDTITLARTDVKGKDPKCIGRYKPSIRTYFVESKGDLNIGYYIKGDKFEAVKKYYLKALEKCGYKKVQENTTSFSTQDLTVDSYYFASFEKDNLSVVFTVSLIKTQGKTYTIFTVTTADKNNDEAEATENEDNNDSDEDDLFSQVQHAAATADSGGASASSSKDKYSSVNEIKPVGDEATQYYNMFKPILEDIYGGAKLTMSTQNNGTGLIFVVKDDLTQDRFSKLIKKIEGMGYKSLMQHANAEGGMVTFQKGTDSLAVITNANDHVVTITIGH